MLGMSGVLDQSDMVLPRHSVAVFKNFCTWMTLDAERSRSLESMVRSVGLCQDFFINAGKFLSALRQISIQTGKFPTNFSLLPQTSQVRTNSQTTTSCRLRSPTHC